MRGYIYDWKKFLTPKKLKMIEDMRSKAMTNDEIATALGISRTTFYEHKTSESRKRKQAEENGEVYESPFLNALERGEELMVDNLERSLVNRATGYDVMKETIIYGYDKDGNEYVMSRKVEPVHIPADTKALEFALINYRKGKWTKANEQRKLEQAEAEQAGGIVLLPEVVDTDGTEK